MVYKCCAICNKFQPPEKVRHKAPEGLPRLGGLHLKSMCQGCYSLYNDQRDARSSRTSGAPLAPRRPYGRGGVPLGEPSVEGPRHSCGATVESRSGRSSSASSRSRSSNSSSSSSNSSSSSSSTSSSSKKADSGEAAAACGSATAVETLQRGAEEADEFVVRRRLPILRDRESRAAVAQERLSDLGLKCAKGRGGGPKPENLSKYHLALKEALEDNEMLLDKLAIEQHAENTLSSLGAPNVVAAAKAFVENSNVKVTHCYIEETFFGLRNTVAKTHQGYRYGERAQLRAVAARSSRSGAVAMDT